MKKTIFGLSLALLTCLVMTGCKKENIQEKIQTGRDDTKDPKRLPDIVLTASVTSACYSNIPCDAATISTTKFNMVNVSKSTLTASVYPNLRYTYYQSAGPADPLTGIETFTRIANYVCNSSSVSYASSLLNNNTRTYIIANLPDYPVPSATIEYQGGYVITDGSAWNTWGGVLTTTGNFKGQSCGPGGPVDM